MGSTENSTAADLASPGTSSTSGKRKENPGCLKRISDAITTFLENLFEKLGQSIGRHPWRYIAGCLVIVGLCSIGMIRFTEVTDPNKLWVPKDAGVLKELDWITTNFPSGVRVGLLMGVSANVLTQSGLNAMLNMYLDIMTKNVSGINIAEVCVKAGQTCIIRSILELWSYNASTIRTLTQAQIIRDVNSIKLSPMYFTTIDLATLLGDRTMDANGDVTGASAALMTFLLKGTDDIEDKTEAWEQLLLDIGKTGQGNLTETFVFAVRSFSDEAGGAIQSDVVSLSIGYFLVIFFVMLVLGKFNLMEQKVWLSLAGIVAVGLAILVSFGLSSAFGFEYGPLQSVLPFLLLGVGVDDMFVLMGALSNLEPEEQQYDLPKKMGDVLRHAGVSVTVTSITDFVAFGIGATTVLPSLQSFCIYAALGILALYFLQTVFFTACMCLDLKRLAARRDACCCWYRHKDTYEPNKCSQTELIPLFFRRVMEPALSKLPVKVIVLLATLTLVGVNVWGFVELEQYFDSNWFLPTDSYAYKFTQAQAQYFPDDGADGAVYCGNIDYFSSRVKLESLYQKFTHSAYIYNGTTDSWFQSLTDWLASTSDPNVLAIIDPTTKYPLSKSDFVNLVGELIKTQQTRHSSNIKIFGGDIIASKIGYEHVPVSRTADQVATLEATRQMVADAGFSPSECFAFSREYLTWETNKVIQEELYRNLALAAGCVFIVTVILIAHIGTSLLVFGCVIFTLVDVAGSMHFWGLTIDTVTTIILILAIGLAVDYSAHIGHMFMTVTGTRSDRVQETLGKMGPPVFYGGFSTFLAFALLASSNSYVFTTFFKVFLLVVIYGLFHGLFFLPVILSWIGPQPYSTADRHFHPNHPPQGVQQQNEESPAGTHESKGYAENGHVYNNPVFNVSIDSKPAKGVAAP